MNPTQPTKNWKNLDQTRPNQWVNPTHGQLWDRSDLPVYADVTPTTHNSVTSVSADSVIMTSRMRSNDVTQRLNPYVHLHLFSSGGLDWRVQIIKLQSPARVWSHKVGQKLDHSGFRDNNSKAKIISFFVNYFENCLK